MACRQQRFNQLISLVAAVFLVAGLSCGQVDAAATGTDWNYHPDDIKGPENWHLNHPDCGGVMQSPINIISNKAVYDRTLQFFDTSDYGITNNVAMTLENIGGHTAEVIVSGREQYLKGGSLPDTYRLLQLHFHWGSNLSIGSEHSINGKFAPLEVHFVHYQRRFPNGSYASSRPHGLAVISFLFKRQVSLAIQANTRRFRRYPLQLGRLRSRQSLVDDTASNVLARSRVNPVQIPVDEKSSNAVARIGRTNSKYQQLLQHLNQIPNPDDHIEIPTFPIKDLLPTGNFHFYRYPGSLTTPPCHESVIWSVAIDPIEISSAQLNLFRTLYDEDHHHLVNDFRPVQPINRRTVFSTKNTQGGGG